MEPDFSDLHIKISHGLKDHYVALSHCWGGPVTHLLTTKTIDSFACRLPYSQLPANFRDAVSITRNLGFRYLWIDCLCIIQDSKHDWEVESMKMADVYTHAILTISALASLGSTSGILAKNSLVPRTPKPVKLWGNATFHGIDVTRKDLQSETLRTLADSGPLYQRGWCLQELLLSPRHLFYGKQKIYWRCPNGFRDAEGHETDMGRRVPDDLHAGLAPVFYADMMLPHVSHPQTEYFTNELLNEYYDLVHEYSTRKLTFGSDKLTAFSGIARRLHPVLGGDYLAGLWSNDIHRGLCWRRKGSTAKHAKPSRSPSWSWAVTDEEVNPFSDERSVKRAGPDGPLGLKLLSHDLNLESPYGEIISGSLVVQGLTRPLQFSTQIVGPEAAKSSLGSVYLDETYFDETYVNDEVFLDRVDINGYSLLPGIDDGLLVVIPGWAPGPNEDWKVDQEAIRPEPYILLAIYSATERISGNDSWWLSVHFLILRQKHVGGVAYERVGVAIADSVPKAQLRQWETSTITLV